MSTTPPTSGQRVIYVQLDNEPEVTQEVRVPAINLYFVPSWPVPVNVYMPVYVNHVQVLVVVTSLLCTTAAPGGHIERTLFSYLLLGLTG